MSENKFKLGLKGINFEIEFDKIYGKLSSYKINGKELIHDGFVENFWRAPTDNDERGWIERIDCNAGLWREAGFDMLKRNVKKVEISSVNDSLIKVKVTSNFGKAGHYLAFDTLNEYTITGDGKVQIKTTFSSKRDFTLIPRLGLTLQLKEGLDNFCWFGRGPQESYLDRKESALVGIYNGTVDDQFENYIIPQENGNKTETRWASVVDENGIGLLLKAKSVFDISVHHYTAMDLTNAMHTTDLKKRKETIVNVDWGHTGIGNASCGPDELDKYKFNPKKAELEFTIIPIK